MQAHHSLRRRLRCLYLYCMWAVADRLRTGALTAPSLAAAGRRQPYAPLPAPPLPPPPPSLPVAAAAAPLPTVLKMYEFACNCTKMYGVILTVVNCT